MTKEEKIIATAFTGKMFIEGSDMGLLYEYMEKKVGHKVCDLILADKGFWEKLHKACEQDFIDMVSKEQPSLPSDSDEAARDFAKTTFKKPYSDSPDEEVTIVEPDKYAGFIAGVEWDREQMMKEAVEGWVAADSDTDGKRRVTFFSQKPVRDVLTEYKYWAATRPRYESIKLDSNAFPDLKWEDEPKKVKLIIIEEG